MYRLLFLTILFNLQISLFCQNLELTKQRVEKLSSKEFYGRGYINNGVNIAADYISLELKKIGVKPFGNSYLQEFNTNVNTFPSKLEVKIDNMELIPGEDYIPGPSMESFKGRHELVILDSLSLNDTNGLLDRSLREDFSQKFLVIDYKLLNGDDVKSFYLMQVYTNFLKFAGIIELIPKEQQFIVSVSTKIQDYAIIKLKQESFYENAKEIFINVKSKYVKNFKAKNIIGFIEGEIKNEFIVFSAHYDHVGGIGKNVYIPGAQDNASGTAMLLDLAEYYSKNKPKYSIVFMFFGAEELGLLGSKFYVKNPLFDLSEIKLLINLDMVGTGHEGITIVNAKNEEYRYVWNLMNAINDENNLFETINARDKSDNSDHAPFNNKNVPAIFIYTMGDGVFYHSIKDRSETLSFVGYNQLFKLLTIFVSKYE